MASLTATRGLTVVRILLGTQLRRLRQASGVTVEVAGHVIRASHTKISRMERGRVGFHARDVAALLTLYGVTDHHQRQKLLALARQANAADWAHYYSDLLPKSPAETVKYLSSFLAIVNAHRGAHVFPVLDRYCN